jgi:hypothetical protein
MAPKVSVRKSKGGWGVYISGKLHDRYETKKDATKEATSLRESFVEEEKEEAGGIKPGRIVLSAKGGRPQDNVKSLLKYAEEVAPQHLGQLRSIQSEVIFWNTDRPHQIVNTLVDIINTAPDAPKGYYFGVSGVKFGWWKKD